MKDRVEELTPPKRTEFSLTEGSQRLRYRRQFLLARGPVSALSDWNTSKVGHFWLYSHPDLEVLTAANATRRITLMGYLFSATEPQKSNSAILQDVLEAGRTYEAFLLAIKVYAGRYVFIYEDEAGLKLVQDPLSLREVYYCTEKNLIVCGSQPNLVAVFSHPKLQETKDPEKQDFYRKHMRAVRNGTLWVGDETFYDGINHLLPNYSLDLNRMSAQRYWPNTPLPFLGLEETAKRAGDFLQGMMQAVTHRHSVMLAVTAGTDSRTLLAASKGVKDRIYYFINKERNMTDASADISVPTQIFKRLGLPFHVHEVPSDVDEEFRKVFLNNAFFASDRILSTVYNVYYKNHSEKVNLLGVGEIGRALWGKEPRKVTPYYLAYSLRYKNSRYATQQCGKWLQELLPVARQYKIDIMSMLLWEQLLGNWGAVGNSESDIAIEEFDPYDSHYMYETLLGIDENSIGGNRHLIFREMVRRMWPELLDFPINPPDTRRKKISSVLKKVGIYKGLKKARYQINYARFSSL